MDTPLLQKPRTMAELLPGLSGILTTDARQALTTVKQPRPKVPPTLTAEKAFKPMTLAEMRADIKVLNVPSPRRPAHQATSTKKKWNSSVKVRKSISLTGNNQGKNNSVRKVLNFMQPRPISQYTMNTSNVRKTVNPSTPKFLRPEIKAKQSLYPHAEAHNILSISGIHQIEDTPLVQNKPIKSRMTIANKENIVSLPKVKAVPVTPKSTLRKRVMVSRMPDTPLSNESWKSSCDDSFIQNEIDIELSEKKNKPLTESNVTKDTAKISTPYEKYRNVNEYFNNSSYDNSSAYEDTTIMCFETKKNTSEIGSESENKREESDIVALCDMLKKATVSKTANIVCTDLDVLLEIEKQAVHNLAELENSIKKLQSIRKSELKSLQRVRNFINEKRKQVLDEKDKTMIEMTKKNPSLVETPVKSQVAKPCSVKKSCLKSPTYKIPKKMTSSVRKKVHYKSLPNIAIKETPNDMGGKALNVYLKMKEHMNFLTTPAKQHPNEVMDTPMIASKNLQKQLDKLYSQS